VRLYESAEQFLQCGPVCDLTCIISDVRMPGLSGVEMYRELAGRGERPPIIFISAFASEKVRRQAFDAGAACVLSKPVDCADVMRCLESVRSRADGRCTGRPPAASR
jgi:FixJ family two-component response regulator